MNRSTPRRAWALSLSATMLASLTVAAAGAPAAAQVPTCDGQPATITDNDGNDLDPTVGFIVGTDGPDVIVGSDGDDIIEGRGGRDIICGGLGNDAITGYHLLTPPAGSAPDGRDRIFGGSGNDTIEGGPGNDDLFGLAGDDTLYGRAGKDFLSGGGGRDELVGEQGDDILKGNGGPDRLLGQAGNDKLDGGAGVDDCRQGPGSGSIRRCEKADLVVSISSPTTAPEGTIAFKVRVKNRGPNAVSYFLSLDEENTKARCDGPQPWEPGRSYPVLKSGGSRTRSFSVTCVSEAEGDEVPRVWVDAKVVNDGRETRPANNGPRRSTTIIE